MLRSLVGSEMCIRDRPDADLLVADAFGLGLNPTTYIPWAAQNGAQIMLCLLYTSDAADDLLCVDLGGRRIIKKKKNPT